MVRYEYPVVYMGSYRLNYQEYDGSHPWVDIRAPIWTPVLSVANWVVIKVKDTESWDWKYVIIRHDNVNVNGNIETLYSGYEHLSSIVAIEWTKIKKWEVLWYVWITWITTTPHLHFQIDKKEAPFHAYWPYTFQDASNAWLDFFSAVNVWLGKENAIAYTINPMEFIQSNLAVVQNLNSAPDISQINTSINTPKNLSINPNTETVTTPVTVTNTQIQTWTNDSANLDTPLVIPDTTDTPIDTKVASPVIAQPVITPASALTPAPVVTPTVVQTNTKKLDAWQIFYDIPLSSKYYKATKYLYDNWITKWYSDWNFWVDNPVSRWEALIFIFKTFNIKLDSSTALKFKDIPQGTFLVPYLQKAIDLWYIAKNTYFRQNDTVTRAEFITMLIKASWKTVVNSPKSIFSDVKSSDWYAPYANTFASLFPSSSSMNFYPNTVFNRWQIGLILYSIKK